jgi:hypothetical protein
MHDIFLKLIFYLKINNFLNPFIFNIRLLKLLKNINLIFFFKKKIVGREKEKCFIQTLHKENAVQLSCFLTALDKTTFDFLSWVSYNRFYIINSIVTIIFQTNK